MESSRDVAAAVPDAVDAVVDAAVQILMKRKKLSKICMVNKGVGSHGQFDRLYVLPVRDRDRPLHCRCFYLSGISLVQEMAGEKKRRKVQHG